MNCPECGTESRGGSFCGRCGTRLGVSCRSCGRGNPRRNDYCAHCGEGLDAEGHGAATTEPTESAAGERRQLTVLFCDLVGSTDLAARLDPEEYREVLHRYHRRSDEVLARYGGHVAQHLGDGLLVYFGFPHAYDDAAERAVRSGLALIEAAASVDAEGLPIAVRVGLHTGTVVVGDVGSGNRRETLALGDAPNVAARVQAAARPGEVLVTAATQRLVSGLFIVEDRGPHELKGVPAPVVLYRAIQPSGIRGRLAATAAGGYAPFVDRTAERAHLHGRFAKACAGEGQVVLLVGEAGIGKSRLVQELRDELSGIPHTWLETGGSPFYANTPFSAASELLRRQRSWCEATPAARAQGLGEAVRHGGIDPAEALPLLAPLLDLPLPEGHAPPAASADVVRDRLLAVLVRWVVGTARLQPLVIVVEDLHWVDPSSLELLRDLAEQSASEPILLVCTARPQITAPWPVRAHHTRLSVDRLPRRFARDLAIGVAARSAPVAEVIDAVMERSDGVPLFVEELTKAMIEAEGEMAREIPATLADSLMARLDRLGASAKEVAQIGAVCGREFSYALLRAVHPLPAAELTQSLARLVDAELLYPHGMAPDATYTFKHALVQDAAYASLLKSRRRLLHGRVAAAILEHLPELADAEPERLAHHLGAAQEGEAATAAWLLAGERALGRGAYREAAHFLARGLEALADWPAGPARDQAEFRLCLTRAQALFVTQGYGANETMDTFSRALEVGERVADPDQLVMLIAGLAIGALHRDGPDAARPLADKLASVAERAQRESLRMLGRLLPAMALYQSGAFGEAHGELAACLREPDGGCDEEVPVDPRVVAATHLGFALWQLGFVDRGRTAMLDAVERAARSSRTADRVIAEQQAASLFALLRDPERAHAFAGRALAACEEEPNPVHGAVARIVRAWAEGAAAEPGGAAGAIRELRDGIDALAATGQTLGRELYCGLLAELLLREGRLAEAESALAEGEGACPSARAHRAMTLAWRAELRAAGGAPPPAVEAAFQTALEWATRHDAHAHRLRIATRYAGWMHATGRSAAALALLEPLLAAVSEGHDTRDYADASTLVEELRGGEAASPAR